MGKFIEIVDSLVKAAKMQNEYALRLVAESANLKYERKEITADELVLVHNLENRLLEDM